MLGRWKVLRGGEHRREYPASRLCGLRNTPFPASPDCRVPPLGISPTNQSSFMNPCVTNLETVLSKMEHCLFKIPKSVGVKINCGRLVVDQVLQDYHKMNRGILGTCITYVHAGWRFPGSVLGAVVIRSSMYATSCKQ